MISSGRWRGHSIRKARTLRDLDSTTKTTSQLLREQQRDEDGDPDDRESAAPSTPAPSTAKPHPRAQWEERRGVWMLWDDSRNAWVDLSSPN